MIYLYLNGEERGPFSREEVQAYLKEGLVRNSDLARSDRSEELRPLLTLLELPAKPPLSVATKPVESSTFRTSLHWIVLVRYGLFALLAFLFLALPFAIAVQALTGSQLGWFVLPFPAFILVAPIVSYWSSEVVITNQQVRIKAGVMRRQSLELLIARIESIAIDQSLLARFLDYGTVVIRGTGGFEERFEAIAHPLQFRGEVQRLQNSAS